MSGLRYFEKKEKRFTPLSENDWAKIKEISRFLKPFKKATLSGSGAKITTLSELLPWYSFLLDLLDEARKVCKLYLIHQVDGTFGTQVKRDQLGDAVCVDLRDACESAFAKLDKYFQIHSELCVIATILDPRLKTEFWKIENNSTQSDIDMGGARRKLEGTFALI